MNIADIIAALQRGEDPSTAIPGAFPAAAPDPMGAREGMMHPQSGSFPFPPAAAPPPSQAQAQVPASSEPKPPVGVPTPVTNPQPPGSVPTVTQSPPDLANMYVELMTKNQNARAMDSGLSLIAAGLSPYQATRTALIGLAGKEEQGKMGLSANDVINLQKQQLANKQMAMRQQMLPQLAAKHNIDATTIQFLEASGKLDEVIQNFMTENFVHIKDDATGEVTFYNGRTGQPIVKAGGGLKPTDTAQNLASANAERAARGEPPLTTEEFMRTVQREAPAADDAARLATMNAERKATGKPPMTMEELLVIEHPRTEVNVSADGVTYPKPEPGHDYIRTPDGKVKIHEDGLPKQVPISAGAAARTEKTAAEVAALEEKEQERAKKENRERVAQVFSSSNVGSAVDKALVNADRWGASGFLSKPARDFNIFGGMPSDALDANLKTIEASEMIRALTAMRAASQTGAGLGSVSDWEGKQLASTTASLNPNQPTAQLKEGLIRVKASMLVMAENKYENEGDAPRFLTDLENKITELRGAERERTQTKGKVRRIE